MRMPVALFAACVFATVLSVLIFFIKRARFRRWCSTSGTVVELIRSDSNHTNSSGGTLAPRVRFQTADRKTIEFVSSVSSSSPIAQVGEKVAVLYDPLDPNEATIDYLPFQHLGEGVVFCFGLAGIIVFLYQRFGS